jgi:hypothetical protein
MPCASGTNSSGSGEPGSGCAGITMVGNGDRLTWDRGTGHFRDMDFLTPQEKIPGQIEITIKKITVPGN